MSRVYTVTLDVACTRCDNTDTASVAATSAEDARLGAMKVMRYRGWTLPKGKGVTELCPVCAGPIPTCDDCTTPVPDPYQRDGWPHPVGSRLCARCDRRRRAERWRADHPGRSVPEHLTREVDE